MRLKLSVATAILAASILVPSASALGTGPVIADSFGYPVAAGSLYRPTAANDGDGWYDAQPFATPNLTFGGYHLGEDWNGETGGDSDLGQPVYAIADGVVMEAGNFSGWGNIVLIRHKLPDRSVVTSQYAHLDEIADWITARGRTVVRRGDQIGTIGKGCNPERTICPYPAHLHLEIRSDARLGPTDGGGYSDSPGPNGWLVPSEFIDQHRSLEQTSRLGQITVRVLVDTAKHLTLPPDDDFRVELDGGQAIALGASQTFTWQRLKPGEYEIGELLTSSQTADGWQIEFIECSPFGSEVGRSPGSISVSLEPKQSISCVFENFHETVGAPGEVIVKKETSVATAEVFEFQLDPGPSSFVESGGQFTWTGLAAGNYLLSEVLSDAQRLVGWSLLSANCGATAISPRATGMTLFLRGGERIVCSFSNEFLDATPQYLSFVEGDPGAPGDAVVIDAAGGTLRHHFELVETVPVTLVNQIVNMTVFPELGSAELSNLWLGVVSHAPAPCDGSFAQGPAPTGEVVVAGVLGYVVPLGPSFADSLVIGANLVNPGCGLTEDDLSIDRLFLGSGLNGGTPIERLDAASILFGVLHG